MFYIFNYNVHNYLVDFGASTNIMPLSVAQKINTKWKNIDARIIQLDRSLVQEIGELNNVIIHFSLDHRVHQLFNIIIVDISETYGLLLSKYWSKKLQGYFLTDSTHLWLPYKQRNIQIQV